jgi:hypothetical protein
MERFLKWSTGCFKHPWVVLLITGLITIFLGIGVPKVKFDNDLRAMLPANNHDLMVSDYYEDENAFGHSSFNYIGVESGDAFSVESLSYLRTIKAEIEKLNQTLPAQNVAKYLGVSTSEASSLIEAAHGKGINEQTMQSDFLPLVSDSAKAAIEFGWDAALAHRLAGAVHGVAPIKLYHVLENPIKKTQSLIDADYIVNRDDELVSEKLMADDAEITPAVAQETKNRAKSWNIYESTLYSKDGTMANMAVQLNNVDSDVLSSVASALKTILAEHKVAGLKTYLDGEGVIGGEMGLTMKADLKLLMPLVLLVVMFILFFCFRKIQGVIYPMIVVLISVVCSMGAMGWLGAPLTLASVAMPPLMVAIASAYGIHQMNHYLLDPRHEKREIFDQNMSVVGLAIVLSGVTVMVGFGALATEQFVPIRNFGIFTALGDLVAVAVALWALPAMVLISKKPKTVEYHESSKGLIRGLLNGFVNLNREHSSGVVIVSLIVTLCFCVGFSWIKSELNNVSFFKQNTTIRQADDELNSKLAGTQSVIVILDSDLKQPIIGKSGMLEAVPSSGDPVVITTPAVLRKIDAFSGDVQKQFGFVHKVMSFDDALKKMNQEMNGGDPANFKIPDDPNLISQYLLIFSGDLQSELSPNHDKLKITVTMQRRGTAESEEVARYAQSYFGGDFCKANHLRVEVAGTAHMYYVANALLMDGMIKSIVICVILVFLILFLLLKDLRMSLISISPILATLVINFGCLGFFNIPLNTATAMVSSIAVGIGVDYSIHFITWYRSELRRKRDINLALENSILHKGRAILYNMFVVFGGFLILVFSNFVPLIQFGLLVAICMLTTAFGSLAVVPAIIRVLARKDRRFLYLDKGPAEDMTNFIR